MSVKRFWNQAHLQNLISYSLIQGLLYRQNSQKFIHNFLGNPANIQTDR